MADLVQAKWVAGFEAQLSNGTILVPGETVVELSRGEAEGSDNWEVQGGRARKPEQPSESTDGSDD